MNKTNGYKDKREYFFISREIWDILLKLNPSDRGKVFDYIFEIAFDSGLKE